MISLKQYFCTEEGVLVIYTVKNLTDIPMGSYGLIGCPVEHSVSPYIHALLEKDSSYVLINIEPCELEAAVPVLKQRMSGFNVTIPHKESVVKYLDKSFYPAVNTVCVNDGKLIGYNTDIEGFIFSVKSQNIDFKNKDVLVCGAGGAAYALATSSKELGANVYIQSRTFSKTQLLAEKLNVRALESDEDFYPQIILNTTPLGMWPKLSGCIGVNLDRAEFVFDAIYNPVSSILLKKAKLSGIETMNGALMLTAQAALARQHWKNIKIPSEVILSAYQNLEKYINNKFPQTIVLTGFMGCGKTTTGKLLAESLKLNFNDLDNIIECGEGCKTAEIFKSGEYRFRQLEGEYLKKALDIRPQVLSLGGGTVCFEENLKLLKQSPCITFYLKADFDILANRVGGDSSRPLFRDVCEAESLYNKRLPNYEVAADFIIDASKSPQECVNDILNILI